jgi:hypothetical protein
VAQRNLGRQGLTVMVIVFAVLAFRSHFHPSSRGALIAGSPTPIGTFVTTYHAGTCFETPPFSNYRYTVRYIRIIACVFDNTCLCHPSP